RADFLVYKHVMPWDHAPGSLILAEVSGQAIRKDGKDYSPAEPVRKWLIAGSSDIPRKLLPYLSNSLTCKETTNDPEDILSLYRRPRLAGSARRAHFNPGPLR